MLLNLVLFLLKKITNYKYTMTARKKRVEIRGPYLACSIRKTRASQFVVGPFTYYFDFVLVLKETEQK